MTDPAAGRPPAGRTPADQPPTGPVRRIAWGTVEHVPAWRRPTAGERTDAFAVVAALAVASQFALPERFALHPRFVAPIVELAALLVFGLVHPRRVTTHDPVRRAFLQALLGVVAGVNLASVVLLVHAIVSHGAIEAVALLAAGGEVWLTNVLVFGMWYWLTDRGGPGSRAEGLDDSPDLLFPQMTDDHLADEWEPRLLDYLYVSLTNSTAFSPTDTLPLSRWTKVLFSVQSLISLVTVALVAARAVNVLPGS